MDEEGRAAIQAAVERWQQEPTMDNADAIRDEVAKWSAPVAPQANEAGARWQADQHLRALLRYTESFYGTAIEHGMKPGPTANCVAHVERAAKALHALVHAWANVAEKRLSQPALYESMSSSDRERIEWCLSTVRDIADLGREKLGDLYPEAVMVCGALNRVLEPNIGASAAAPPADGGKA
jgi:hypothetical protein